MYEFHCVTRTRTKNSTYSKNKIKLATTLIYKGKHKMLRYYVTILKDRKALLTQSVFLNT